MCFCGHVPWLYQYSPGRFMLFVNVFRSIECSDYREVYKYISQKLIIINFFPNINHIFYVRK